MMSKSVTQYGTNWNGNASYVYLNPLKTEWIVQPNPVNGMLE
jgi:hypothetical protein